MSLFLKHKKISLKVHESLWLQKKKKKRKPATLGYRETQVSMDHNVDMKAVVKS